MTITDRPNPQSPNLQQGSMAPPRTGMLLTAFIFLLFMSLASPIMAYSDLPNAGEGSPARQAGYLLVFLLTLYGVNPFANPARVLVIPVMIAVALGWCWLSTLWSLSPGSTLRRIALTSMVIWSIFAIVRHLGYEKPVAIIRVMLAVLLMMNVAVSLALPDIGVHHVNEPGDKGLIGDWRGIMFHKNFAAPTAVLAILFFLFDARRIPMILRAAVIVLGILFLANSGSKTSVGIGLFAVLLGLVMQFYTGKGRALVMLLLAFSGIAAAVAAYIYIDPLAMSFTDERSFTGRPLIWKALVDFWKDHPWTGSGYGAFWNIGGGKDPIFHYATGWVTQITIGHNGYLDILAQLGIPGLALILIAVAVIPTWRLLTLQNVPAARLALIVSILYFCIGHNSTESSLFERDAIPQVFLMIAIAFIETLRARPERQAALQVQPLRRPRSAAV